MRTQFVMDVLSVCFNSEITYVQLRGTLTTRFPFAKHFKQLLFTPGEFDFIIGVFHCASFEFHWMDAKAK